MRILDYFATLQLQLFMKKWILILLAAVAISLVCVYGFIPSRITVSSAVRIAASENGVSRFLLDENKWPVWWSAKDSASSYNFTHNKNSYFIQEDTLEVAKLLHMAANVVIRQHGIFMMTQVLVVSLSIDTT